MTGRSALAAIAVVAAEAYLVGRYQTFHALWHFWLHALLGVGVGVAVLTGVSAARRRPPSPAAVWAAAFAGHLLSALPDVLFLTAGMLHAPWMDVFAAHIGVHFLPAPLAVSFAVFALGLLSWPLLAHGRIRTAAGMAVATVLIVIAIPAVSPAAPRTLEELRAAPQLACRLPAAPDSGLRLPYEDAEDAGELTATDSGAVINARLLSLAPRAALSGT